jgi:Flp pilus assembly protein TadG
MTRRRGDRGSVAVEVAVVAPAIIALLMLVLVAGRVSQASGDVQSAATAAARAASLRATPAAATSAAQSAVDANLADAGLACASRHVGTATDLRPGGSVTVAVTCSTDLADVVLLGVPGSRTFSASATAVVDSWRGNGDGTGDPEGDLG